MKKMLFALLVVLATLTVRGKGIDVEPPHFRTTWYTTLTFTVNTPYGVPKLDADGNIVKDEKGSPIIALEMRKVIVKELLRLRIDENTGEISFAFGYPADNADGYVFVPCKGFNSLISFNVKTGTRIALASFEYEFKDRGLGLAPVKCMCYGNVSFLVQRKTGEIGLGDIQGSLVGFNDGGDGMAFSSPDVEGASAFHGFFANPILPVEGTWRSNTPGYKTGAQIRSTVNSFAK